jgi:sulfite exporter TauE/SafE
VHAHPHTNTGHHVHVHQEAHKRDTVTPWILFLVFLFGPCEPLIPLLMYPAANGSLLDVLGVSLVFGLSTIVTMTAIVLSVCLGVSRFRIHWMERYAGAIAGFVIMASGAAVVFGL